jgi:hypothetical protein
MQAFHAGIVPARSKSRLSTWLLWTKYCATHSIDPTLSDLDDSISFLQVFAQRYRSGSLAPNKKLVRARTVEAALRSIGQTVASLGSPDPRLNTQGNLHYVLQQQLKGYARSDAPASRVQPVPFPLIAYTVTNAITPLDQATADLAIIGFFFLLRPGEHTHSAPGADSHPFRLCDVSFRVGSLTLAATSGDTDLLSRATFAALTFTRQKNGTENEVVGHARSGHSSVCPVLALIRRCLHLRTYQALPTAPLCSVYLIPTTATYITPQMLTAHLRRSATILLPTLGFHPHDISARSLRAGGAMALLCANVDSNVIKLIGRWRSDEMLRYLHLQSYPQMRNMAPLMAAGGAFRPVLPPPDT